MEQFEPQAYCNACFRYEAELYCQYANNTSQGGSSPDDTNVPIGHRQAACGTSYITVTVENGNISWYGQESYDPDKEVGTTVTLTTVNIPGIENMQLGDTFSGARWESVYQNYTWHHAGSGKVTSWEMTKLGHPNHS